jgi:hypothetical protein
MGLSYSHLNNMIVCTNPAHVSMAARDGCYLWHVWSAKKRQKTGPKKLGGGGGGPRGEERAPTEQQEPEPTQRCRSNNPSNPLNAAGPSRTTSLTRGRSRGSISY